VIASINIIPVKMAESKNILFIPIPGSVTGDLWHLAAAQILSLRYSAYFELVTVVVVTEGGDSNEILFGRATFNYLRDLELPCMVVKISGLPEKASKKLTEIAIYNLADSLQNTWETKKISKGNFDEELHKADTYKVHGFTEESLVHPFRRAIPKEDSPILQLMTATTIAIQILCAEDFEGRWTHLRQHMVPQSNATIYEQANEWAKGKWEQLKDLINTKYNSNLKMTGVLLYLNRKNPQANINTNSSEDIQRQVEEIAKERNMIFQVVAVGADPKDGDFDLFNKKAKAEYPGLNPCATAMLWGKVRDAATLEGAKNLNLQVPIFGIFSGRTGSIDLPAFCGVNCFFWDEPWLQAAGDNQIYEEFKKLSMFYGKHDELTKDMDGQISQCLRSLQLYPIMATGLVEEIVDIKSEPTSSRTWRKVRKQEVDEWFERKNEGKQGKIYPQAPSGPTWNAVSISFLRGHQS
jgi:hypothetical protein